MDKIQAGITLQQLGGMGLLKLMIGAKNFTYDSSEHTGLRFKFECSDVANMIEISLRSDLYTMKFFKIAPLMSRDENGRLEINPNAEFEPEPVEVFADVENDKLVEIFESVTKLTIRPFQIVAA
jgi:hypothetical protein